MNPRMSFSSPSARAAECGGVAIVVVLVLLSVMSVAAFGLSRSTLRELVTAGTLVQGTKAAEAAEAGIDWFITWSEGNNLVQAQTGGGSGGNATLLNVISNFADTRWNSPDLVYPSGVVKLWAQSGRSWDQAVTIPSNINATATNEMVFDTTGAVVQQTQAAGNVVRQKFDVTLRYLGEAPPDLTGGGGNASGNTDPRSKVVMDMRWQLVSDGTATVLGPNIAFQQRREAILQSPRFQLTKTTTTTP